MARRTYSAEKIAEVVTDFRANGEKDIRGIAKRHGVSTKTIQRWAGKTPQGETLPAHVESQDIADKVDAHVDALIPKWERAADLSVDKLVELIPDVKSPYQAALIAGITTDKRQLLRGLATSRVETQVTYSEPGTFKAYVQGLRDARLARIEGPKPIEVIDVTPKDKPEE